MAQQPVFGVARVVFRGVSALQPVVNVMHVQNNAPTGSSFTQPQIDQLATSMASLFVGNLVPLASSSYVGIDCTATDLSSDLGVVGQAPMIGSGLGSGPTIPNSTCVCISWKIPRHYRGGHPRTYIGPLATSSILTNTTLATAFLTTAQNAANAFRTAVNALSLSGQPARLVCVHRIAGGVTLADPLVDGITGNVVDTRIDTQRRRLGKDR